MAIENFDEVKQYLEQNKDAEEVKGLFTGFIPKDNLDSYIDSEDGKKLLQPRFDKYFTKGLDTWKANNLSKIVDDEVAKRNPAETPEQKMIREMQEKLNNMERQSQLEKLKTTAVKTLNEKGLPVGFVDLFNADTEEGMNNTISYIETTFKQALENAVNEKLKGKTPEGKVVTGGSTELTKAQVLALPMAERVKFFNENSELFNKIMNS